jgi:glycosyltransferase involved in cell wall biosynthesis
MAAGRPVAAAASGQVARLLTGTKAGIPSPPGDAGALAESIRRLASDAEAARRMGESGRRYVTEHLSRRAMVDKLDAALEAIHR